MIISKEESKYLVVAQKMHALQKLLQTNARSSEARAEIKSIRATSLATDICPYCGEAITERSPSRVEACVDCGKRIARMLMVKSKIKLGTVLDSSKVMTNFRNDYAKLVYVPKSLGSDNATAAEMLEAIDNVIVALSEYHAEQAAARMRRHAVEANRRLHEKHRNGIIEDLRRLGADASAEGFEERVDEICANMYPE